MARVSLVRFGTTPEFLGFVATKDLQNVYCGWLILQAMPRHPVDGVAGSKPRLSSRPGPQTKELAEEYLEVRNRQQAAKAELAEIALLEKKGSLISRQLAGFQGAYLLTVFRQNVLAAPADVARRLCAAGLVAPEREHEAQQMIKADFCALLAELAELPRNVVDPNWIAQIDPDFRAQVTAGAGSRQRRLRSKRRPTGQRFVARSRHKHKRHGAPKARVGLKGLLAGLLLKPAVAIDVAEKLAVKIRRNAVRYEGAGEGGLVKGRGAEVGNAFRGSGRWRICGSGRTCNGRRKGRRVQGR